MVKIIVDHRESKEIIRELVKQDLDVEVKQLNTADIVLQTKDINNHIKTIGIERKTQSDFINSIIDKRIINQLIVLKENFEIPLLIIEGTDNIYTLRNMHPNAIRGMLSSIAIDYQIPIIHTRGYRDTAALVHTISKRLEKSRKPISLLAKRKPLTLKEKQELIIETFPGIGPSLAKALLKEFKTVKKIINASEEKLQKVEKLGPKKASEIKKVIEEMYEG